MKESARLLRAGTEIGAAMAVGAEMIKAAGFALDYFELRNAETLAPITSLEDEPLRILVAARLGTTRLIDNIAV
jgi:pantoate--beta-alanine ligase